MSYTIYDPSASSTRYHFDKSTNSRSIDTVSVDKVENRLELKTFGRFPYIYYAGETNYRVFDLTTVFVDEDDKNCRDQVDDFKAMLMKRVPLVVENAQGQVIVCDVVLSNESSPKLHALEDSLNYISITVRCTEIQDYFSNITIKHIGNGRGTTSATQWNTLEQRDILLGSATGGEGTQYSFTATYGNPLNLKATATHGEFISWTGLNNPITTSEYPVYSFADGIVIEARFEEVCNITVIHEGGSGITTVTQDGKGVGRGVGGNGINYQVRAIGDSILHLKATPHIGNIFVGWRDGDGNILGDELVDFYDGMTLIAMFRELAEIVIMHKGSGTGETQIRQGSKLLGSGAGGRNVHYKVQADSSLPLLLYANPTSDSRFVRWEDIYGNEITSPLETLPEDLGIYAVFEKSGALTVMHKGVGSGTTSVTQNNVQLGTRHGGENTAYTVDVQHDAPIVLMASADAGYTFVEWQDAATGARITPPLNGLEGNKTIYAIFAIESVAPGSNMTADGGNEYHEQEYLLGSKGGRVVLDYYMYSSIPDRAEIWYNGTMVACTNEKPGHTTEEWKDANGNLHTDNGFVLDDGTIGFNYNPVNFNYTCKVIIKPKNSGGTAWRYTLNPPV